MVPKLAKREVGLFVGSLDGSQVGEEVGSFVGSLDGSQVGEEVGLFVGIDCMRLRLVRPLGTGADRHTSHTSFVITFSPETNWKALEVVLK